MRGCDHARHPGFVPKEKYPDGQSHSTGGNAGKPKAGGNRTTVKTHEKPFGRTKGAPKPREAPKPKETPKPKEAPKVKDAPKPSEGLNANSNTNANANAAPKPARAPKPNAAPKTMEAPKGKVAPKTKAAPGAQAKPVSKPRGGETPKAARGREIHEEFKKRAKEKRWTTDHKKKLFDPKTGREVRPDALTRNGNPIELKPNTPSGRAAGKRQLKRYEDATKKKGRLLFYDP